VARAGRLLFRGGAGEGGGDAERDQHSAGDVALGARPTCIASQPVRNAPGRQRPQAVAQETEGSKKNSQEENLARDAATRGIHELREKSEEEEGRFWIHHVYDDALREDATQPDSRRVVRNLHGFLAPQFLHAEIDQIGRAEILYDPEGEGRGHISKADKPTAAAAV